MRDIEESKRLSERSDGLGSYSFIPEISTDESTQKFARRIANRALDAAGVPFSGASMSYSGYYRERAAEAEREASAASLPMVREQFMKAAESWARLARHLERLGR